MNIVFIYNDFRIGNKNNFYLYESRFLGIGKTLEEYTMIGIKRTNEVYVTSDEIEDLYPKSFIKGEVYEVSDTILEILDYFMLKDDFWFRKKIDIQVNNQTYTADMYFMNDIILFEKPLRLGGKRFFPVPSGDWSYHKFILQSK